MAENARIIVHAIPCITYFLTSEGTIDDGTSIHHHSCHLGYEGKLLRLACCVDSRREDELLVETGGTKGTKQVTKKGWILETILGPLLYYGASVLAHAQTVCTTFVPPHPHRARAWLE